jgi:hypothetical protein
MPQVLAMYIYAIRYRDVHVEGKLTGSIPRFY